ncbi:type III-B CRISPR module-associated protein Cmr5 [Caldicoprobacter faecalis]|uniref:CRISPR type III-B/RAMP module-associated protein Cmr5 n=1 Tax=Caldicoprobacter faecalis TaxID=937334 RepID=A0A1I5WK55_9FIRM|nr:type III-B CRISPR module-associated protein Cmr5 [Caldicoprobacter faecalis]PZN02862.1 MAG: type III-B CRISPR module-associated protein Cmr5 [Bacillota bacterium]SFQ19948.1 CRISPR-associated protein Cmr5 [Caldicoprobacter faecalis]
MGANTQINKLEKGRAYFAYECVENATRVLSKEELNNYRSYTEKIPIMILTNGLGQTLAFIKAKMNVKKEGNSGEKKENAYKILYDQISDYLKSEISTRIKMDENKDLVEWVISCHLKEYRFITQEILAFMNWLKRFAEGMIEEGEGSKNEK